jgi:CRISPR system Cascade subunit CasA
MEYGMCRAISTKEAVMDERFNVLDEPWIPCTRDDRSLPELMSVRAVLAQAASLRRIVDPRPTCAIAMHRFLLALLHRALQGPRRREVWREVWHQRTWDLAALDAYMSRWHPHFYLFDPDHPFYQTPGLDPSRAVPINTLAHDRASDVNSPMIFDHQLEGAMVTPGEVVRLLLGHQHFATQGLISDDQASAGKVSASASPLMGTLVCLAQGQNLFETLMLNWVQYDPAHELPFAFRGDDRPVWERVPSRFRDERFPDGYVDLLTWACRRILLIREHDSSGRLVVKCATLMDGTKLDPTFPYWQAETMAAFHRDDRPNARIPWPPLPLKQDRTIWRDSHALLSGFTEAQRRPAVLNVFVDMLPDNLADYKIMPLDVAGVIPHQKNVVDWRYETLPVPRRLLTSQEMVSALHTALELAEQGGKLLAVCEIALPGEKKSRSSPMKVLAREFIKGLGERDPQSKDYQNIANHLNVGYAYWSRLDLPFRRFLQHLPDDIVTDAWGEEHAESEALPQWARAVGDAAQEAFKMAVEGLGETPRAMRAGAKAQACFDHCRKQIIQPYVAAATQGASHS